MTPCEVKGYKIGDLFQVIDDDKANIKKWSIVKLFHDDATTNPVFRLVLGEEDVADPGSLISPLHMLSFFGVSIDPEIKLAYISLYRLKKLERPT